VLTQLSFFDGSTSTKSKYEKACTRARRWRIKRSQPADCRLSSEDRKNFSCRQRSFNYSPLITFITGFLMLLRITGRRLRTRPRPGRCTTAAPRSGLVAYCNHFTEQFPQAAVYVDRILKGAKPAELPVQATTTFVWSSTSRPQRRLVLTCRRPFSHALQALSNEKFMTSCDAVDGCAGRPATGRRWKSVTWASALAPCSGY
jgi:hypothetical protein